MSKDARPELPMPSKGRFILGVIVFVIGVACPVFIPLVVASDLPSGWKAVLSGLLALGIPELFMIAAAAILGKSGFTYLQGVILAFIRQYGPPASVNSTRYRVGLVLFLIPLVIGWLGPYLLDVIPRYEENLLAVSVSGDVMLLSGLLLLGGDFWDKLKALFIHEAKAQLPNGKPFTDRRAAEWKNG
jgi:ABC-type multidrug transport system fused ATPase/permease subunit